MQMQLHIARHLLTADAQTGLVEIRAAQQIPPPGMHDAQQPSVFHHRMRCVEFPAQPDLLQEPLGKRKRTIEPLNFRYRQILFQPFDGYHDTSVSTATSQPCSKYQSIIFILRPSFCSSL